MSDSETKDIQERLGTRITALAAAQKRLKRASTLPLVERRVLAAAVAQSQASLEALISDAPAPPEEPEAGQEGASEPPALETALTEADAVLARVAAAEAPPGRRTGPRPGFRPGDRSAW